MTRRILAVALEKDDQYFPKEDLGSSFNQDKIDDVIDHAISLGCGYS